MQLMNRNDFLRSAILLPGLAALMTAAASAQGAKASKDSMHYQSTPRDGKQCAGCQFFIPSQDPKADGTCKIVDGAVSPNGYCMAYTAK